MKLQYEPENTNEQFPRLVFMNNMRQSSSPSSSSPPSSPSDSLTGEGLGFPVRYFTPRLVVCSTPQLMAVSGARTLERADIVIGISV